MSYQIDKIIQILSTDKLEYKYLDYVKKILNEI